MPLQAATIRPSSFGSCSQRKKVGLEHLLLADATQRFSCGNRVGITLTSTSDAGRSAVPFSSAKSWGIGVCSSQGDCLHVAFAQVTELLYVADVVVLPFSFAVV